MSINVLKKMRGSGNRPASNYRQPQRNMGMNRGMQNMQMGYGGALGLNEEDFSDLDDGDNFLPGYGDLDMQDDEFGFNDDDLDAYGK